MNESWVAIQRNPNSGSGRRRRHLLELIAELRKKGLRPRLYSHREKLDEALLDSDRRNNLVAIVAAGGDGTVSDVINRHPNLPVCPFPLGTENVLCKYLGIGLDAEQTVEVIANGERKNLDIGLLGDSRFLLMASVGFDAEVIRRLHNDRTGNIRKWTYVAPILKTAWNFKFPELRVYLDDHEEPIPGRMVVVSNLPAYAFGLPMTPDAVGDDGKLSLCIFQRPGGLQLFRYWIRVKMMKHMNRPDIVHCEASRVRIESDSAAPIQIDGDPAGMTPCEIRLQPASVCLITPN